MMAVSDVNLLSKDLESVKLFLWIVGREISCGVTMYADVAELCGD